MKEEKRTLPKLLVKALLTVIAICIIYAIVTPICFNKYERDESSIQSSYETEKQKIELLKEISENCIDEGIGISIQKDSSPILEEDKGYINQESISYKIYSKDENIIIYYEIKEPSKTESKYNATITLSKEFEIINEDYSIKLEDLEDFKTYKQQVKHADKILIRYLSIVISLIIVFMIKIIIEIFLDIRTLIKNRKK